MSTSNHRGEADSEHPLFVVLGGLPGSGKTTLARALERRIVAVHIRIDSIEHAIQSGGQVSEALADTGYRVGYAVARDNIVL